MCMGGGGGGGGSNQQYYYTSWGVPVLADRGLPQSAIDQGIFSTTQYQIQAQKELSDKQLAQQKDISDQQMAFNQQQLADTKAQQDELQAQSDAQSQRQTDYDTGRAGLLAEGTQKINDAFSRFSPDYFDQYSKDYMTKATDDINYQKGIASKQLAFGLARQGLGSSQAAVDQRGLLEEDAGRATALQGQNAADATNTLKGQVASTKQNLLGQVTASESIGSPIAGGNNESVNTALDTSRRAVSGVTNSAGDVTASLGGVPTVSPLSNIFANVLGGVGSYIGGNQAQNAGIYSGMTRNAGLSGSSLTPGGSTSLRSTG